MIKDRIIDAFQSIFYWIRTHKMLVFVYLPVICILMLSLYVFIIYNSWLNDRGNAIEKLAKYKLLIDRTEELKKGYIYSYSDVDLSAKVVDIPTRIYDRNDDIIGEFFEQKREIVPYDFIPQWLVKGVIASEDRDFYKHRGMSYKGIFRAFMINIVNLRVVQGGSTLTQQLAKVLFTDMERNLKRKIYEAFCAMEIERKYDKQDILSMYLNLIYFGNGAYGVESTSKMFFGKSVKKLNEVECAMIVATISNPRLYSPLSNLKNSVKKTRRILTSLTEAGYLPDDRAERNYKKFLRKWDVVFDEKNNIITSNIGSFIYSTYKVNRAPFFNEHVRRVLVEKFGEEVVKRGGLSVYTTIDGSKQDEARRSLVAGIQEQRNFHIKQAGKISNINKSENEKQKAENIEGALVALDPYSGEILAYAGGFEFSIKNQYDHASQIKRQPGSSIKPLVYLAAIQDRDITPSTVLEDTKTTFGRKYTPRNYNNKYLGEVIAREALRRSINVPAVKVLEKTGFNTVFEILENSLNLPGSEFDKRFEKTLAFALGSYELSPMENCVLHATIVNGGLYIEPYGIKYVKDYNGNIVWNNEETVVKRIDEKRKSIGKIMDPVAAAVTISMLKGVFEEGGTAYYSVSKRNIDFEIAGKTGTSSNYVDAWFMGYTSDLVTSVWIGNKKGAISLGPGRAGGVIAAPVWVNFITSIYRNEKPADFSIPSDGISKEKICLDSGKVANKNGYCPNVAENQLFYSGSEPGEYCHLHTKTQDEKKEVENKEETE